MRSAFLSLLLLALVLLLLLLTFVGTAVFVVLFLGVLIGIADVGWLIDGQKQYGAGRSDFLDGGALSPFEFLRRWSSLLR